MQDHLGPPSRSRCGFNIGQMAAIKTAWTSRLLAGDFSNKKRPPLGGLFSIKSYQSSSHPECLSGGPRRFPVAKEANSQEAQDHHCPGRGFGHRSGQVVEFECFLGGGEYDTCDIESIEDIDIGRTSETLVTIGRIQDCKVRRVNNGCEAAGVGNRDAIVSVDGAPIQTDIVDRSAGQCQRASGWRNESTNRRVSRAVIEWLCILVWVRACRKEHGVTSEGRDTTWIHSICRWRERRNQIRTITGCNSTGRDNDRCIGRSCN